MVRPLTRGRPAGAVSASLSRSPFLAVAPAPRIGPRVSRWTGLRVAWLAAALFAATPARGQELPLKPPLPDEGLPTCPGEAPPGRVPTPEEIAESLRLGSAASQALILGDPERARDLLDRATELDPTSTPLHYQYGRVLENLGQLSEARSVYCRIVAIGADAEEARDARVRLDALAAGRRPSLPQEAVQSFQRGVDRAVAGDLEDAVVAFSEAVAVVPDWGEAYYDRGLILARLERPSDAADDLRRYLELRPSAPDARAVSEMIGQLDARSPGPGPGTALTLGLLVPGMGQLYSGRPGAGLTVLTLAGGAVAAALLVEEVTVRCLAGVEPGATCPPEQVFEEEVERPYLVPGIAAAGAVMLVGAIEAFVWARSRSEPDGAAADPSEGPVLSLIPTVEAAGDGRVRVGLLRLRF